MSHFSEFTVSINDQQGLVDALRELGFSIVEVHTVAQPLYGYHGDKRAQKANIIIRRQHIGSASNDIGFEKMPDGTYRAWISDYDKSRFNDAWLNKLKGTYTAGKIKFKAKLKGWRVSESVDRNVVKLVLIKG
jgi:hypothetical protein